MFNIQVGNEHAIHTSVMQNVCHLQVTKSCTVIIRVTNQTLIRLRLKTHQSIISNNDALFHDGKINEFFVTFI